MPVMMKSIVHAVAAVAACLLATGCPFTGDGDDDGLSCDTSAAAGISVTVLDADTDVELCEATVIASDGEYDEILQLWFGEGCSYVGLWERDGDHTIAVSHDGYEDETAHVLIPKGRCHVEQQFLVVRLDATE